MLFSQTKQQNFQTCSPITALIFSPQALKTAFSAKYIKYMSLFSYFLQCNYLKKSQQCYKMASGYQYTIKCKYERNDTNERTQQKVS